MSCCGPEQFLVPLYISPLVDEVRETYQELQNNQGTVALTRTETTYCPPDATSVEILWNRILRWAMIYRYVRRVQNMVEQNFWDDSQWKGSAFFDIKTAYFDENDNPIEPSFKEELGWDIWDGETGLFRDILHHVQQDLVNFVTTNRL